MKNIRLLVLQSQIVPLKMKIIFYLSLKSNQDNEILIHTPRIIPIKTI